MTSPLRTPLYDEHLAREARMVPFAGWSMPLHYGSQIAEHHAVRQGVGMFDVSHMRVFDAEGAGATDFLRTVFAGDVARLAAGRALYGVLLNENAGIIDDAIVYRTDGGYRVVSNAGTSERVHSWLLHHLGDDTRLQPRRDLAMLAVQGPRAIACLHEATGFDAAHLPRFAFAWHEGSMVARTGYTGEDGVEVLVPAVDAASLWRRLADAGAVPAGLGARDTLRLEAGLNLHGHDMDESTPPTAVGLGWTVAWGEDDAPVRRFIGRDALERQRRPDEVLRGIVLEGRGVMREGFAVTTERGEGTVTSGIFSPTLGYSIALARLPRGSKGACGVQIRSREVPGRIVRPPFLRSNE
ncbi:MAG: glycine cleavage system aminomethyltransferase GcvT [Gammaproteobacteria bacterium]|nr:glycine cleavage system aminomethyltransferase GcvT [Gammaproteobacteria bacterium]MYB36567.1 glycine cleavage system aminomethyltransferase GcvT [Gammaproteobacteria bacterium]